MNNMFTNMFEGVKPNRHERRKLAALRRKSKQKQAKGAFGLPVFYPEASDGLTNHERHLQKERSC